jgi:arginase family enzyme
LHIDLDNAWDRNAVPLETLDATEWGPALRFSAPPRLIEKFYAECASQLTPFLLYGSGDFHHLTALWMRRLVDPFNVISFDNHPDWDVRPPKWGCGGWVNRALELPKVQTVSVWGCGNFECWWPRQIFGNRRAERNGKLQVHPWADGRPPGDQKRRGAILRDNWRSLFDKFAKTVGGSSVYVTIDLDCLAEAEAVTNWESGRFQVEDLTWALTKLREQCRIVAGDICGAFSEPRYARWKQRFASEMDHPKMARPAAGEIQATNFAALEKLWPCLAE